VTEVASACVPAISSGAPTTVGLLSGLSARSATPVPVIVNSGPASVIESLSIGEPSRLW
jgi:hypothetical protein